MTIINLTPHAINIYNESSVSGSVLIEGLLPERTILPSGVVARVSVHEEFLDVLDGIPVYRSYYGSIEGLPAPEAGTFYIVSALTAAAAVASGRDCSDLLTPVKQVRDASGRVVGCLGFNKVA